jgi:hypothetical protein
MKKEGMCAQERERERMRMRENERERKRKKNKEEKKAIMHVIIHPVKKE